MPRCAPRLYEEQSKPDPGELMPEAVMPALVHALEAAQPRTRYRVTRAAHLARLANWLLPDRMRDRIFSGI